MFYTVYKITNKLNAKFYIGKHKTKNLDDGYMGSGKLIKDAIKKHGIDNFKKEILHVFETEDEMNEAEARLVVLGENSYNLCPGGQGGFGHLNDGSDEHIKRCKQAFSKASSNPRWGVFSFKKDDPRTQQIQKLASEAGNLKRKIEGLTEDHRSKISKYQKQHNSMKNRCWCVPVNSNSFNRDKKVFEKNTIPIGWIPIAEARDLQKRKSSTYGACWIYNPDLKQNKYCRGEIPSGWFKGRKMEYYQETRRSDS